MAGRTKLLSSIVVAGLLLLAGCAYNQQSRFQTFFLPATPHAGPEVAAISEPPLVQPDWYSSEIPNFIRRNPVAPLVSRTESDLQKAEQHYQRGKRLYQAQDFDGARQEFNTAIDGMLAASGGQPADRQAFDKRFEEMVDAIHRYDLAGLGAAVNLEDARYEKAPLEDILEMTFPVDPKLKDRVQEQVRATASQLPLSVNDAVLGYIHYFSSGRGRKAMIAGMERAGRYKALISRILDEEGLPQELIHLAQAESGFLPRAMSRKAAGGMWQFVAWRGQQYGLMQTRYTDERFDPEKATHSAARHLHDLYNHFGDWYLAIAAYNCGPGVVEKAVERTGYADFWELRRRGVLPLETANYVPIILALTIMEKNAAEYGLENVAPDPPAEYANVEITSPTHLALVADLTDTPVSELMQLNPALLKGIAAAGYLLHVPKGSAGALMAALQMIPAERRASWRVHKAEEGETLAAIGKRFGASASAIAAANRLASGAAITGQRLLIPVAYTEPAGVKRAAVRRTSATHRSSRATVASSRGASRSGVRAAHTTRRAGAARSTAPAARRKGPAVLTRTASNTRHRKSAAN